MTYLLRDVDDDTWTRVRARAKGDGLTIRAVILLLLAAYARGGISLSARLR